MGIDTHTLKFLIFASRKKPLGRVATIGRAGLHVPKDKLRKIMKLDREVDYGGYCEDFLREQFDASAVESFDKSDYENATHIADIIFSESKLRIRHRHRWRLSRAHLQFTPSTGKHLQAMCR